MASLLSVPPCSKLATLDAQMRLIEQIARACLDAAVRGPAHNAFVPQEAANLVQQLRLLLHRDAGPELAHVLRLRRRADLQLAKPLRRSHD